MQRGSRQLPTDCERQDHRTLQATSNKYIASNVANMNSSFSLSFLEGLGPGFTDQDVEAAWEGRLFPLVCTNDFKENWRAIPDSEGIFVTSSGVRCTVLPQPHHEPSCKVLVREDGNARYQMISYEAVIFAKVVYQISLNSGAPKGPDTKRIGQVERRQFIDNFVVKLPKLWQLPGGSD